MSTITNVPHGKEFQLHMGASIRNIRELLDAFEVMDDSTFNHHVSKTKNDFKEWVSNVLGDKKLAEDLTHAKTKEFTAKKIRQRLAELERPITISKETFNKFGLIDFSIGVAVGIILGILLSSLVI